MSTLDPNATGVIVEMLTEFEDLLFLTARNEFFGGQAHVKENAILELADAEAEDISPTRAITMLNNSGDSSIAWTEENDAIMEKVIAKKMAEGISFFIVKPRFLGIIPMGKKKAQTVSEAMQGRAVSVRDVDFAEVIASGCAHLVKRPEGSTHEGVLTTSPKVAARSHTVAVGAMAGG